MELTIGSKVILTRAMLNEQVGSIGFVFSEYPDFDDDSKIGVQIIFQNGSFDGFSDEEQHLYLEDLGVDSRYQCYEFNNVNQVDRDFRKGYWSFDDRHDL